MVMFDLSRRNTYCETDTKSTNVKGQQTCIPHLGLGLWVDVAIETCFDVFQEWEVRKDFTGHERTPDRKESVHRSLCENSLKR